MADLTRPLAFRYVTNCTDNCHGPGGEAIHAMADAAEDLTYAEFESLVGRASLVEMFPNYDWRCRPRDLTLKKDRCVSFHRSVWRGIPCVYLCHSRNEYIFTLHGAAPDE